MSTSLSCAGCLGALRSDGLVPARLDFSVTDVFDRTNFRCLVSSDLSTESSSLVSVRRGLDRTFSIIHSRLANVVRDGESGRVFTLSFNSTCSPCTTGLVRRGFSDNVFDSLPLVEVISSSVLNCTSKTCTVRAGGVLLSRRLITENGFRSVSTIVLRRVNRDVSSIVGAASAPKSRNCVFTDLIRKESVADGRFS